MGVLQLENVLERKRGLKRIEKHSTAELNLAIKKATDKFGENFWLLLHGIDAYMERRKRHDTRRYNHEIANLTILANEEEALDNMWGHS